MEMVANASQQLWRTDFDKQYTRELIRELVKQATALVKRYERFTPRKSTNTPEDRIHTAVMKLMDGSRTWDPTRVDLGGFLLGVIASDLTSELRRSKMAPQISLDDQGRKREDDYTGEPCDDSGAEARASNENGWPVPLAPDCPEAVWSLAMTHLRERAGRDARVLALLGAYEEGAYTKRDVMALLNWSAWTYKQAYQRLLTLADAADEGVRESIAHAFAN